jgi:hypothetical protein
MVEFPVHLSSRSHGPVLGRQTVSAEANWQLVQHGLAASSQAAPARNRQVEPSQQLFWAQLAPQSHSSPTSTMPFPHCPAVMVVILLLLTRQLVLTVPSRSCEQMVRMLQGENAVCDGEEAGFMMYCPFASQVEEDRGQHCPWVAGHVADVQSWMAPKVWPDSWL